ncbi:MAG: hypothetical protein LBQ61_07845, partial [Spirochaetales bacterium]|nr:hypothetical protein [Spirochaetales bacterium]
MAGGKPKKTPLLLSLGRAFPQKTRDELYALILCGEVRVDGAVCRDPKAAVRPQGTLDIAEKTGVSRGTVKLAGALEALGLEVAGLRVLDAGASTGGFTRRLLDRGAAMVYAVDVGYNQLDYPLRRDPRVRVMERTNIMQVSSLEPPPDLAVSDLSFRSIVGAAPHILSLCRGNLLLALIKPQFEYRNAPRDFTGVVRSPEAYREILEGVAARLLMRDLGIA